MSIKSMLRKIIFKSAVGLCLGTACAMFYGCGPDMPRFMTDASAPYQEGGFDQATGIEVQDKSIGTYGDRPVYQAKNMQVGVLMPDENGGYVWLSSGQPMPAPSAREAAARELKLKVRELADQIFAVPLPDDYRYAVALPVSFVNMDNFEETSSFGRYIAEQMYYELNQRGVQVKEYRNNGRITIKKDSGEFYLNRKNGSIGLGGANVVMLGTYYSDKDTVFVNARLVKASDGAVIRTGLIIFPQTQLSKSMIARRTARRLESAKVRLRSASNSDAAAMWTTTVIDIGNDIH